MLPKYNYCFIHWFADSSFAITCGGYEPITSSDGTVYEIDSKSFKSASYYVTDQKKWAVSSVGIFVDNRSADFILRSTSQFSNTREPELYQTARMSPSSLRYYGLGLENGNYTIKLHFAETKFLDPPNWTSVGRRVFDIYIQVSVLKSFVFQIYTNNECDKKIMSD